MPAQAHALVQDARDADPAGMLAKHDHVLADQTGQVRRRQVVASVTIVRVATDGPKRFVDLVAVGERLGPRGHTEECRWATSPERRSPRLTTRWNEMPTVRSLAASGRKWTLVQGVVDRARKLLYPFQCAESTADQALCGEAVAQQKSQTGPDKTTELRSLSVGSSAETGRSLSRVGRQDSTQTGRSSLSEAA